MTDKLQIKQVTGPGSYLIRIIGALDENLERDAFVGIKDAQVVIFDFEYMRRVTSFGVSQWMEALKRLKASYYGFVRCRSSVVAQFNMVSNFAGKGQVISFYAPYLCNHCEKEIEELIDLRFHQEVVLLTFAHFAKKTLFLMIYLKAISDLHLRNQRSRYLLRPEYLLIIL